MPKLEFYENMDMNMQIGSLLFDIILDNAFTPDQFMVDTFKHNHPTYEFHYIVSGSGTLWIEQREEKLESGFAHIIGPNVYHLAKQHKHDPISRFCFQFSFKTISKKYYSIPETEIKAIKEVLSSIHYLKFNKSLHMSKLVNQILSEFENNNLGYYTNIQNLFKQMMVLIVRSYMKGSYVYLIPRTLNYDQRTKIIDNYFDNFKERLTVEQLAEQLQITRKQTHRILHKYYKTTFKQKLIDTRMEFSKLLLKTTELTVQQIARETGYATAAQFCAIFKKQMLITPTQYRKSCRSPD